MGHPVIDKTTLYVAWLAALLTAGAFVLGGTGMAVGALMGGVVAIANWLALRWLALRVVRGSVKKQGAMMVLLTLKMGALFALCWLLIARFGLDAAGFLIGISAFVVGLIAASVHGLLAPGEEEVSGEGEG
ncbi:MAG: ATP synthase subunit I [Polyangiales bacterium]